MLQNSLKYSHKYLQSFTGKERDSETGFSYFGARYYDSDILTGWLSVDPLADKYPSLSPYAYCAWNPVKLVDPDGRMIDDYFSTTGNYLGSDNANTRNIRIIKESDWNELSKDVNGLVEHCEANIMISPDSDLYRAHPDWALHIDGRTPIEGRNQLTLDLSRQDVCDYIYESVAAILAENPIDYVKWDMNRNFSNVGSSLLPANRQRELPHRYMLGLYSILEKLIHRFPDVLFESCSSGGGRFDLGMLHYMPQTWCSDNTDAYSRCRIQYSTSLVFPPFAMGSHVSAVPNHQTGRITPLSTRGNVARSGCFGYELDLNSLTEEELTEISQQIKAVKAVRNTLLYGDFYRLLSPYDGNDTAWITVAKDGSEAVFTFERALFLSATYPPVVRLAGLDPAARYRIEETGEEYGGDELMYSGLYIPVSNGDHASVGYILRRI